MLELYTFHGATCGLKSRLVAEEKKLDYVHHAIERPYLRHPDYLKLNPKGVVPTLVHNNHVIVESTIIINYFDNAFDGPELKPADPLREARMWSWIKRTDDEMLLRLGSLTYTISMRPMLLAKPKTELEEYISGIPNPFYRERRIKVLELGFDNPEFSTALESMTTALADLDALLSENSWIAGAEYSLADATLTPFLERLSELQLQPLWENKHRHLSDWWERIRARPSYDACLKETPNPERSQHEAEGRAAWPEIQRRLTA